MTKEHLGESSDRGGAGGDDTRRRDGKSSRGRFGDAALDRSESVSRASRSIAAVAYDEELADRIRELLAGERGLTEQKMFGGLAFLIGGNMAVAASGQGGVLVRVDPAESVELVAKTSARPMEMRGKEMQGWLRVDSGDVGAEHELAAWVEIGTSYARTLPAK